MTSVLAGMASALISVTHLKLFVSASRAHRLHSTRPPEGGRGGDKYFQPSFQSDVSHVPAAVCAMFAAAVPHLQSLSLTGLCVDVSLAVFGASCPQLRSLEVTAILVPLSSLEGISSWFPNLKTFIITRAPPSRPFQHTKAYSQNIESYVRDALPLLSDCSNLQALQLDMMPSEGFLQKEKGVEIKFSDQVWDSLPASMNEFECAVLVLDLSAASSFMGRIRSLTVTHLPCESLARLLQQAPLLEALTITGNDARASMWAIDESPTPSELELLKARFLGGFQLSHRSVSMLGTCKAA